MPADKVSLTNAGTAELDVQEFVDVFRGHRERFVAALRELTPEDWAATTRCGSWKVQDVVRHLADASAIAAALAPGEPSPFDGFDPRTTPDVWLSSSSGESPRASLDRLESATEMILARILQHERDGVSFEIAAPHGRLHWLAGMMHVFWDSWIHERDVLLPLGHPHETDDAGTRFAAAYGLFIAAGVAPLFGKSVDARLALCGLGGGTFDLTSTDCVRLEVIAGDSAGPPAIDVVEAVSGRDDPRQVLAPFGDDVADRLSGLSDFFHVPV